MNILGLPQKYLPIGTSLVVRWLSLCAPNAGSPGSIPGQGTRSHILQLRPSAVKKNIYLPIYLVGVKWAWKCILMSNPPPHPTLILPASKPPFEKQWLCTKVLPPGKQEVLSSAGSVVPRQLRVFLENQVMTQVSLVSPSLDLEGLCASI